MSWVLTFPYTSEHTVIYFVNQFSLHMTQDKNPYIDFAIWQTVAAAPPQVMEASKYRIEFFTFSPFPCQEKQFTANFFFRSWSMPWV